MGTLFIVLGIVLHSYLKCAFVFTAAPVINNLPNSTTVSEGTGVDAQIYQLDVTDADGDSINCDFGTVTPGSGSSKFSLQLSSGLNPTWSINTVNGASYDQNSQPTYTLEILCDANSETATSTFIVTIAANNVPVIQNLPDSVNVSTLTAASGDNVFTVVGTDAENDQIMYSISCSPNGCPFDIFNSGEIQLNADISASTVIGYDVTVSISDSGGSGIDKILTVLFTDINNAPQIQNLGSTVAVLENGALGATVASTVCTDNDASDTLTYTMTCSPASGSTYFLMDSSTGVITTTTSANINYELFGGSTSFDCDVTCSDGRAPATATVTFDITNVNEAPTFSQAAYSISADEGPAGTSLQISGYNITDEDASDSHTFNIDCGDATGYFSIDTSNGELSFATDYDVDDGSRPTSASCNVTVTDSGGLSSTVPLSIAINNINDNAPVFAHSSYVWSISQYDTVGTVLGTAAATDADLGSFGDIVYTIDQSSLSAEYFEVDSSGVVKIKSSISTLGVGVIPTIYVVASDGGGNETRATVTVFISATTTTTTTAAPERYKTFFDDGRNIAWFTACIVVLLITSILIGWMCFSFTGSPQGAFYKFKCCRLWDEPVKGQRNWGEMHRKNFRATEQTREPRRPRVRHENYRFWSEDY